MRKVKVFTEGETSLPYSGITKKYILSVSEKVLEHTETDNVSVSVILTDNEKIHKINREYRGKDKSTDVISFAYRDDPFPVIDNPMEELGDIYISLEKASEQAVEYGVTLSEELKRLIIHGVLHLLGYDHELSAEEEKRMNLLEDKIFDSIKI